MRDFLVRRAALFVSAFGLACSVVSTASAQTPAPAPPVATQPATAQPAAPLAAPPPAPPGAYPAAPAYPPPPGYAYPAYGTAEYPPRLRMPETVPYQGGPVPSGYHLEEHPRRGLVIAGTVILAVPYGLGLAGAGGGNFPNSSGWLILPVFGPWLTLASRHSAQTCSGFNSATGVTDCVNSDSDDVTRTFLILDGLMQLGGAVMLTVGIASPSKVVARDFVGSLHFAPSTIGRDGYGGFVTGKF